MQFTKLKNKHVYSTWVAQYRDLKVYIYEMVGTPIYHFRIRKDGDFIFSSLDARPQIYSTEFDELVLMIEIWLKKNYIKETEQYYEDTDEKENIDKFSYSGNFVLGGV